MQPSITSSDQCIVRIKPCLTYGCNVVEALTRLQALQADIGVVAHGLISTAVKNSSILRQSMISNTTNTSVLPYTIKILHASKTKVVVMDVTSEMSIQQESFNKHLRHAPMWNTWSHSLSFTIQLEVVGSVGTPVDAAYVRCEAQFLYPTEALSNKMYQLKIHIQ